MWPLSGTPQKLFDKNIMNTRKQGGRGEALAALWLILHGYRVLNRNFHFSTAAEIDLIARKNKQTVFVEVKFRTGDRFGAGREAVDARKQANIRRCAAYYIKCKNLSPDGNYRFDVIEIEKKKHIPRIHWLKNAF